MRAEELQRLVDTADVHRALGLVVRSAGEGTVTFEARPGPEHSIDEGRMLHGGVVATLLDTAASFALTDATGEDWSTVDLRVDYLRPVPVAPLSVVGRSVQAGRRVGRASAKVADPGTGRVLASAVGTFTRS